MLSTIISKWSFLTWLAYSNISTKGGCAWPMWCVFIGASCAMIPTSPLSQTTFPRTPPNSASRKPTSAASPANPFITSAVWSISGCPSTRSPPSVRTVSEDFTPWTNYGWMGMFSLPFRGNVWWICRTFGSWICTTIKSAASQLKQPFTSETWPTWIYPATVWPPFQPRFLLHGSLRNLLRMQRIPEWYWVSLFLCLNHFSSVVKS